MTATQQANYDSLTPEEKVVYDSVMKSFPNTHPDYAYDVAIKGGIRFQFVFK